MIYQHREVEPLKEGILDISSTQKLNEVIERLNELSFEIYSDAPKDKESEDGDYRELVPESVRFMWNEGDIYGLEFGNDEQILIYRNMSWQVMNNKYGGRQTIRMKFVPCKLEDIEIGQWLYRGVFDKEATDSYFLRVEGHEYVYAENEQIKRRTNYTDNIVYKIVPAIE